MSEEGESRRLDTEATEGESSTKGEMKIYREEDEGEK